jgi:hypothetical protein
MFLLILIQKKALSGNMHRKGLKIRASEVKI